MDIAVRLNNIADDPIGDAIVLVGEGDFVLLVLRGLDPATNGLHQVSAAVMSDHLGDGG